MQLDRKALLTPDLGIGILLAPSNTNEIKLSARIREILGKGKHLLLGLDDVRHGQGLG